MHFPPGRDAPPLRVKASVSHEVHVGPRTKLWGHGAGLPHMGAWAHWRRTAALAQNTSTDSYHHNRQHARKITTYGSTTSKQHKQEFIARFFTGVLNSPSPPPFPVRPRGPEKRCYRCPVVRLFVAASKSLHHQGRRGCRQPS